MDIAQLIFLEQSARFAPILRSFNQVSHTKTSTTTATLAANGPPHTISSLPICYLTIHWALGSLARLYRSQSRTLISTVLRMLDYYTSSRLATGSTRLATRSPRIPFRDFTVDGAWSRVTRLPTYQSCLRGTLFTAVCSSANNHADMPVLSTATRFRAQSPGSPITDFAVLGTSPCITLAFELTWRAALASVYHTPRNRSET
jgi:hypothetical protein